MRTGLIVGWIVTLLGVGAIVVGCMAEPTNWWCVGPGIFSTVVGLIILAANSQSDWVPEFLGDFADMFIWIITFEWLESIFD